MRWSEHAIWWQVYPLGFTGAEPQALPPDTSPAHRLDRLGDWLDYLVGLGCNGLALGPVFASETHGYDTVDHLRIDSRLGTEDDLRRLVGQAAERGVRVILDGVFNHVGRSFPAFADVDARGRDSRYATWFTVDPATGDYRTFEGHHRLVALNHDEPAVADHVVEVMCHWLELGIAGWRLDAAYAVPHAFWRTVTDRVRARHPDAWFVGEVIHGDYPAFVDKGGLDSVTQYELWKALWSSCNDRNLFELAWALDRHNALLDTFVPMTFLGNHDVTRIASRLDDERHLAPALAVLLTVGGHPSVYSGDEQAFRGVKEEREGGDDAVRPAFPPLPGGLAPHGAAHHRLHQQLIGLRRRHPWLTRARTSVRLLTDATLVYTVTDGQQILAVALSLGDDPVRLPLPGLPPAEGEWRHAAGPGTVRDGEAELTGAGWLVATAAGPTGAAR